MSQPANEPDDARIADILSRLLDLERILVGAWRDDVDGHPGVMARRMKSLREEVAGLRAELAESAAQAKRLSQEVAALKASLGGHPRTFPS